MAAPCWVEAMLRAAQERAQLPLQNWLQLALVELRATQLVSPRAQGVGVVLGRHPASGMVGLVLVLVQLVLPILGLISF